MIKPTFAMLSQISNEWIVHAVLRGSCSVRLAFGTEGQTGLDEDVIGD